MEFALIVPVLMLFIFGLVDLARYTMAHAALSHSADLALSLAEKATGLDQDITLISSADPNYTPGVNSFRSARRRALQAGVDYAQSLYFGPPLSGAPLELVSFTQQDRLANGLHNVTESAALLRPGEAVVIQTSGTVVRHPTLCPPLSGCVYGDRDATMPWKGILRTHPFVVEFRATFRPTLIYFGTFEMVVRRVGLREVG